MSIKKKIYWQKNTLWMYSLGLHSPCIVIEILPHPKKIIQKVDGCADRKVNCDVSTAIVDRQKLGSPKMWDTDRRTARWTSSATSPALQKNNIGLFYSLCLFLFLMYIICIHYYWTIVFNTICLIENHVKFKHIAHVRGLIAYAWLVLLS